MLNYVIGMDGGGTKTEVIVADLQGNVLESFQGGAINYNGGIKSTIDSNVYDIFHNIEKKGYILAECASIGIGTAGISNPKVKDYMMGMINQFQVSCPIWMVGDGETAFAGALDNSPGILLIAGTGSICYGKDDQGNTYRVGGYGHLIDDRGSGYAIGRDILAAVVKAYDGRTEATVLSDMVYEFLNIHRMEELISYVYDANRNKRDIAALSILIQKAYEAGDKAAQIIIKSSVSDLAEYVAPMVKHFVHEIKLVVSGSVLLNNVYIYNEFTKKIKADYPHLILHKPKYNAAYGAVLLAMEKSKSCQGNNREES